MKLEIKNGGNLKNHKYVYIKQYVSEQQTDQRRNQRKFKKCIEKNENGNILELMRHRKSTSKRKVYSDSKNIK